MNRYLAFALLTGCATTPTSTGGKAAEPAVEKQKIVNISHFDVGSCTPPAPALPDPLNTEGVIGALVLARPAVLECFVDPKSRTADGDASVAVKATVSETGATYDLTPTNVTAAGTGCIKAALEKLPFTPLPKGEAPVTGNADYRFGGTSPAVKLGVNAASDVAGAIRLASPSWCDCWGPLGAQAPPALKAHVKLMKGKPAAVTFDPGGDATLVGCLTAKIAALPFAAPENELTVHYPVLLVNSSAAQESADAQPELQFIQLDLIRAQRAADVAVKIGARTNALKTYDALVAKYKAKPDPKLVPELKTKCAAMVKADDDWIAALQAQGEVDARTQTLAGTLKAKDPRWADAETAATAQVTAGQTEVKKAEEVKAADQAVCPKERK